MASPFTVVKGDYCTRLTPAGIIRCVRVQDHPQPWGTRPFRQYSLIIYDYIKIKTINFSYDNCLRYDWIIAIVYAG